jgi:hypothetical protein
VGAKKNRVFADQIVEMGGARRHYDLTIDPRFLSGKESGEVLEHAPLRPGWAAHDDVQVARIVTDDPPGGNGEANTPGGAPTQLGATEASSKRSQATDGCDIRKRIPSFAVAKGFGCSDLENPRH